MSDNTEHDEKRRILKRPKTWPQRDYNVSHRDYHDKDRKACQHLNNSDSLAMAYRYTQCIEMQGRIRQWVKQRRRKTTSKTTRTWTTTTTSTTSAPVTVFTHKYWIPRSYEYDLSMFPPHYYETMTMPPPPPPPPPPELPPPELPPPPVFYWPKYEPPPPSAPFNHFVPLFVLTKLVPIVMLFLLAALCSSAAVKCGRERRHQRRPQSLQATPLLPTVRRETQQPIVRRASNVQLRITNSRPNNNDLPPPYSECVLSGSSKNEEPPPRYSACFMNPIDIEPQVHIRRQNVLDERAHSSTVMDDAQNNLIENGVSSESVTMTNSSDESEDAPGMRTELVFDNVRIVETMSLDLNSNNN